MLIDWYSKYLLDCVNSHEIWQEKLTPGIIHIEHVNMHVNSHLGFMPNSSLKFDLAIYSVFYLLSIFAVRLLWLL